MILYSKLREMHTKMKYKTNMVIPRPLFIFHLEQAMATITNISMPNSVRMEHAIPSVDTRQLENCEEQLGKAYEDRSASFLLPYLKNLAATLVIKLRQ